MRNRLRLGILGTGVAARELYLPALKQLRHRIELVACANRTRSKARDYARLAGISRVVADAEALFALPDVDAILISLPIVAQPPMVLAALAAGKPVLSEKPIGPTMAAGRRLLRTAARFPVPWLIGENYAFMAHVHHLRRWIEAGRLGDIRVVQVFDMTLVDRENPYFHTRWRKKPAHVGGFVVDAGVHVADVVRRCFGVPTEVRSHVASFEPSLLPIDTAVATLRWQSGAVGTWTSCFSARYDGPMLRVYGSRANAELDRSTATLWEAGGRRSSYRSKTNSFAAQFSHFADVVQRGTPIAFTPAEALSDLELMQAIVRGC